MQHRNLTRQTSALLGSGLGAAVCLSNGMSASAAVRTGNITSSNSSTVFSNFEGLEAFDELASFYCSIPSGTLILALAKGFMAAHSSLGYVQGLGPQVTVDSALAFGNSCKVPPDMSDTYIAVRFSVATETRFGWIHAISSNSSSTQLKADKWGYEDSGASIRTLQETLTLRSLPGLNNEELLHWRNASETGIARYAVECRNEAGIWTELFSEPAGQEHYTVKAPAKGMYRLVAEKIDGTTEHRNF